MSSVAVYALLGYATGALAAMGLRVFLHWREDRKLKAWCAAENRRIAAERLAAQEAALRQHQAGEQHIMTKAVEAYRRAQ